MSDTFDLQSAAKYLNIGESTLQELVARGEVPGAKVGKSWVFHSGLLSEWLREETAKQTERRKRVHAEPVVNTRAPQKPGRRRNGVPHLPALP